VKRWDSVVFDNDGVLVDGEPLANRVLAELLTGCGYPVTTEESIRRFMGGTLGRVRSEVEPELGTALPERAALMFVVGFAALTSHERLTDASADLVITAMAQLPAGLQALARRARR
jgi:beta-phosphoglucomutase-like phosphatase (HAD superfamily)